MMGAVLGGKLEGTYRYLDMILKTASKYHRSFALPAVRQRHGDISIKIYRTPDDPIRSELFPARTLMFPLGHWRRNSRKFFCPSYGAWQLDRTLEGRVTSSRQWGWFLLNVNGYVLKGDTARPTSS